MEEYNMWLRTVLWKYKQKLETYRFDRYRNKYDNLSFHKRKKLASRWFKEYPEQVHFTYDPVDFWIKEIVKSPVRILEIGGWRGDLAMKALSRFEKIEVWHNYDLLENSNSQKCIDERYKLISLDDYIWNKSLDSEYNALIATHMIEHIKWKELIRLIEWIPDSIETVLFEAPVNSSEENMNWKGDHSSHILEKGWTQIITEMKKNGFQVEWQEGNSFIFYK